MYRNLMLLCLTALGLATPAASATIYTEVGTFSGPSRIVYYGTDFYPLQGGSIELGEDINGADSVYTLWLRLPGHPTLMQLGLERLPFDSKADAKDPPALTPSQQQRFTAERQVGQQVRARRMAAEGSTPMSAAALMAERIARYKANPAVEDAWTDTARPTTVWWVKWKGQADAERMTISPAPPKLMAAKRRANLLSEAEKLLRALRQNQIVILDNGYRHASTTPAGKLALEQDLIALRQGRPATSFMPTKHVREHLRQSVDLRLVVEGRMR